MHVERIRNHDVTGFSCGVKRLDDWLHEHAAENDRRNLSRTYLLIDEDAVVGHYAVTMGGVRREELPRRLGRGLPAYEIGMVLIGRLAIASHRQGKGLGRDLLVAAIEHAAKAGEYAAARFVAVDPIDERARSFYAVHGFVAIGCDAAGRMFMRIDEALAALTEVGR